MGKPSARHKELREGLEWKVKHNDFRRPNQVGKAQSLIGWLDRTGFWTVDQELLVQSLISESPTEASKPLL